MRRVRTDFPEAFRLYSSHSYWLRAFLSVWTFAVVGGVAAFASEETPNFPPTPFADGFEEDRQAWTPRKPTTAEPTDEVTLPAELLDAIRSYGRVTANGKTTNETAAKDSTPTVAALPSNLSASSATLASLRNLPGSGRGQNINLPMNSNLQISGYKSLLLQYNKSTYFGREGLARYYGSSLGGSRFSTGYTGFDYGSSSYDYGGYDSFGYGDYDSFGYGGSFGGGYSSYGSFGGVGGSPYGLGYGGGYSRADGINVQQELQIGIHGQVGRHTHVAVDYTDAPRAYYGGLDNKQQRIALWYEGGEKSILKRAAFGDITLDLPNARFLQVNRNLFGAQIITEWNGVRLTGFGSRTKGLRGKWRSRGGAPAANPDAPEPESVNRCSTRAISANAITPSNSAPTDAFTTATSPSVREANRFSLTTTTEPTTSADRKPLADTSTASSPAKTILSTTKQDASSSSARSAPG